MANIVRYIPLFHTLYVHMHAWKYPNHVQTIQKKWFAHSHFVRIEIILLYTAYSIAKSIVLEQVEKRISFMWQFVQSHTVTHTCLSCPALRRLVTMSSKHTPHMASFCSEWSASLTSPAKMNDS